MFSMHTVCCALPLSLFVFLCLSAESVLNCWNRAKIARKNSSINLPPSAQIVPGCRSLRPLCESFVGTRPSTAVGVEKKNTQNKQKRQQKQNSNLLLILRTWIWKALPVLQNVALRIILFLCFVWQSPFRWSARIAVVSRVTLTPFENKLLLCSCPSTMKNASVLVGILRRSLCLWSVC